MAGSGALGVVKVSRLDTASTFMLTMLTHRQDSHRAFTRRRSTIPSAFIRDPTLLQTLQSRHSTILTVCALDIYFAVYDLNLWRLHPRSPAAQINT